MNALGAILLLGLVCVVSFGAAYLLARGDNVRTLPAPTPRPPVRLRPPVQRAPISPRRPAPPIPRPAPPIPMTPPKARAPKKDGVARVQCTCGKSVALTKLGKMYTHQLPGTYQRQCPHGGGTVRTVPSSRGPRVR